MSQNRVLLSVALFKLQTAPEGVLKRCALELAVNVSKFKQHIFMVTACPEAEQQLRAETWPEGIPDNVEIIPLQEILQALPRGIVPQQQLQYMLQEGDYPHAIELPVLLRHLIMAHPRLTTVMQREGLDHLLTADVNDIWTQEAIDKAVYITGHTGTRITYLQDVAMTCSTAPNLAAVLGGGVCIHTSKLEDYRERVEIAAKDVLRGCENLKARRFSVQVKLNYQRLTGEGHAVKGTVIGLRLMTDQAIVGLALELQPSLRGGAIEVQYEANQSPSGWYGTTDGRVYLQDTEIEELIDLTADTDSEHDCVDLTVAHHGHNCVDLTADTDSEQ